MKKERFRCFFTFKIDFESQILPAISDEKINALLVINAILASF